jgi:hypothetical protein
VSVSKLYQFSQFANMIPAYLAPFIDCSTIAAAALSYAGMSYMGISPWTLKFSVMNKDFWNK